MIEFDKIDDYISNRLTGEDRKAFEHALEGDPALKEQVAFQQEVVQGVRQARVAELKQMLNQVPITSTGWSSGQIAAAVVSASIVATSFYFYFQQDQPVALPEETQPGVTLQPETTPETPEVRTEPTNPAPAKEEPKIEAAEKKNKVVTPVQKPEIKVVDPTEDFKETEEPAAATTTPGRSELSVSKMEVVTSSSNKKYTFHYQFAEGKLQLYGPFDRTLYEILEINGDSHAVFLFYKENYYLLDETQETVTQLVPIRDGKLLQKLREYRGR